MSHYNTKYSLIRRAMDSNDPEAWEELLGHYKKYIIYLLNEFGVDPNERDDISQEILIRITKKLSKYDREKGRFRSWLKSLIHNTMVSYFRRKKTDKEKLYTEAREILDFDGAQKAEIDRIIEDEWQKYISTTALDRISQSYKGSAIMVFKMSLDGYGTQEIADKLDLTVDSVYVLKKRVKKSLIQEVRALISELEHE